MSDTGTQGASARTVVRVGDAPPSRVWQRYADLDEWARWAPQITRVDAPSRTLAPGLRGRVVAARVVRVHFVVLDVDAPTAWRWRVRLGPIALTLAHTVEPTRHRDGELGTRTTLSIDGPRPVVAVYAPVARLALGRLVRRQPETRASRAHL